MYFSKQLNPVVTFLKGSSKTINLVLIILLVAMLFPVSDFFPFDPIQNVEKELVNLFTNPFMMSFLTFVLYCVYLTNNNTMFILLLFIIHRLVTHGKLTSGGGSVTSSVTVTPTPPRPTPPPPKAPPTAKVAPPAPPAPKIPPTPPKMAPPPKVPPTPKIPPSEEMMDDPMMDDPMM